MAPLKADLVGTNINNVSKEPTQIIALNITDQPLIKSDYVVHIIDLEIAMNNALVEFFLQHVHILR